MKKQVKISEMGQRAILYMMLMLPCTMLRAQQVEELPARRWSYGIVVSPGWMNRSLKSTAQEGWMRDKRNATETGRIGFSAGLLADRKLSRKVSLRTGVVYHDLGFKTKEESLEYVDNPSQASRSYAVSHYRYIQVPVEVYYTLHNTKSIEWFAGGGISPAVFARHTVVLHSTVAGSWKKNKDSQSFGFDRFNVMATVSAGARYRLSARFALEGSIYYKRLLGATNTHLDSRETLYATGLSLGCMYRPARKH